MASSGVHEAEFIVIKFKDGSVRTYGPTDTMRAAGFTDSDPRFFEVVGGDGETTPYYKHLFNVDTIASLAIEYKMEAKEEEDALGTD